MFTITMDPASRPSVGESDIMYIFLYNIQSAHVFEYYFGLKNFLLSLALLVFLPLIKRYNPFSTLFTCIPLCVE